MSISTQLIVLLATPFLAALLCPFAYRWMERKAIVIPLLGALIPTAFLIHILVDLKRFPAPYFPVWTWVDAIPLRFSFIVDGAGAVFALLVAFVGSLIVWYAHFYMEHEKGKGRFFAFLLFFLGSMLGIALSDHMMVTFLFWELTSISSFLLIGFWHKRKTSRSGALKALIITSAGGLVMMAGFCLLGAKTHLWEWTGLSGVASTWIHQSWATWAFVLILIGVFSKSAQFPFHIWLPDAMEAPTPVSAFLHSATMVKAGVFLLFRLYPLFSDHPLWFPLLTTVGMTTFVVGSVLALKHTDLKAILAYTTIAQLGLFVVIHGYAAYEPLLLAGLMFHIFVHAFYKGSLFMLTGIIDHATGTRDIRKLGSLKKFMPRTGLFTLLAAASLAGLPPFLGFISKEGAIESSLHIARNLHGIAWFLPVALLTGATITIGVAGKISLGIFFGEAVENDPLKSRRLHEASWGFLLSPALLALAGLFFGVFPSALSYLLEPARLIGPLLFEPPHVALWHGISLPLVLSGGAVLGGYLIYRFRNPIYDIHKNLKLRFNVNTLYDKSWEAILKGAQALTTLIQNGSTTSYLALTIGFTSLLILFIGIKTPHWSTISLRFPPVVSPEILITLGICLSTLMVVLLKDRFARILSLGSVGILLCVYFTLRGAPDLALTGYLVEVVMFVVILLVFKQLAIEKSLPPSALQTTFQVVLAGTGGLVLGALVFLTLEIPLGPSISDYFLHNSEKLAGGFNAVNVIVVDFRGFDTLGEISVLCLAGLGIYSLRQVWVENRRAQEPPPPSLGKNLPSSEIFRVVSHVIFIPILIFSLYMVFRGHNQPGGGFIGGLITASALILELLASGNKRFLKYLPVRGRVLFGIGLALSFLTGASSLLLGYPFLTSWVVHSLHFSTAAIFDFGVYLVVVGVTLEAVILLEQTGQEKAKA